MIKIDNKILKIISLKKQQHVIYNIKMTKMKINLNWYRKSGYFL